MKRASFGTVSHGTMRNEDLIPSFCETLRDLKLRSKELSRIETAMMKPGYFETEESIWDLEWLFDKLNEYAPRYAYFGAHPGDGSDFGFWVSDMLEYDFDGEKVSDLSDIPHGYIGDVLLVNDHGNASLYHVGGNGHLYHEWSVV